MMPWKRPFDFVGSALCGGSTFPGINSYVTVLYAEGFEYATWNGFEVNSPLYNELVPFASNSISSRNDELLISSGPITHDSVQHGLILRLVGLDRRIALFQSSISDICP